MRVSTGIYSVKHVLCAVLKRMHAVRIWVIKLWIIQSSLTIRKKVNIWWNQEIYVNTTWRCCADLTLLKLLFSSLNLRYYDRISPQYLSNLLDLCSSIRLLDCYFMLWLNFAEFDIGIRLLEWSLTVASNLKYWLTAVDLLLLHSGCSYVQRQNAKFFFLLIWII